MANVYDSIKEKENQIAICQAEISCLQAEIEALRLAARFLQVGSRVETARPVGVQRPIAAGGDKNERFLAVGLEFTHRGLRRLYFPCIRPRFDPFLPAAV